MIKKEHVVFGFYWELNLSFSIGRFEAFQDNMTPDEILSQAQAAAQDARDILAWKKPKTKVST